MINLYDGNNVMLRQFENTGWSPILSLRQRYEKMATAMHGTEIWIWDGRNHNERRRDIYPPYKMNRTPKPEDSYAQIKLWREVLRHTPATQIEIEGWEADDVIGTMARKLNAHGVPTVIHTNDMDYGQLEALPHVTLSGVNTKGIAGRWIPLYKAFVGDSSDNIAGVPNFGPTRWAEMADHWPQMERAVVAGSPAGFEGLPFKPAVRLWLQDPENVKTLQNMLLVTHMFPVPDDEISGGILHGIPNYQAGVQRLMEFHL